MRNRPPDPVEPPRRRNAGEPENVIEIYPVRDPSGVEPAAQEKIATAVATDPFAGIRARTLAVRAVHQLRCGLQIDPGDARQLDAFYRQRRGEIAALLRLYS